MEQSPVSGHVAAACVRRIALHGLPAHDALRTAAARGGWRRGGSFREGQQFIKSLYQTTTEQRNTVGEQLEVNCWICRRSFVRCGRCWASDKDDDVPPLGFSPAEDTTGTGSTWVSTLRRRWAFY